MNKPLDDVEARLGELQPPPLPSRLKHQVLASATLPAGTVTWRDRVWYSRGWRLAAVGACLVLLGADAWIAPPFERGVSGGRRAERELIIQAGNELGLPANTMASLTDRALFGPVTAGESRAEAGASAAIGSRR